ncbi:unnamed protein product [Bubo scandiacus]
MFFTRNSRMLAISVNVTGQTVSSPSAQALRAGAGSRRDHGLAARAPPGEAPLAPRQHAPPPGREPTAPAPSGRAEPIGGRAGDAPGRGGAGRGVPRGRAQRSAGPGAAAGGAAGGRAGRAFPGEGRQRIGGVRCSLVRWGWQGPPRLRPEERFSAQSKLFL